MLEQLLMKDLIRALAVNDFVRLEFNCRVQARIGRADGGVHAVDLTAKIQRHVADGRANYADVR